MKAVASLSFREAIPHRLYRDPWVGSDRKIAPYEMLHSVLENIQFLGQIHHLHYCYYFLVFYLRLKG